MICTTDEILEAFPRTPWPSQLKLVTETLKALETASSVVACTPTGGGKTLCIATMINLMQQRKLRPIIYNFRRLLVSQMGEAMAGYDIHHGVRSAAHKDLQNLASNVQVASIHTDIKRVMDQQCWDLHNADYVFIDEAHLGKGPKALELMQAYMGKGAKIVGFTATPASLSHIYRTLVVSGSKKELRACGAHVPARVFAPHHLDLDKVRRVKTGEFSMDDVSKNCWGQQVVGHLLNDFHQYNPDKRQTLHFGPGVKESVWVTDSFEKAGIPSVHIDAKEVIIRGKRYSNSVNSSARTDALDAWDAGDIVMMSNMDVLKEGIDRVGIYCLMLTRPIGSLVTYDQIVGRLIRRSPATPEEVVLVDMAGNYHRHGSPNADRDWQELFNIPADQLAEAEEQRRIDRPEENEPICCPECGMVRASGARCPRCGNQADASVRKIIEADGTLREVTGKLYKAKPPRKMSTDSPAQKRWDALFFASKNSRSPRAMNFRAAAAVYERKYGEPLPSDLKRIPKSRLDWGRKIRELGWRDLT